eukprot:gb/GECG01002387.1/.p1 GENE.gb/GECG01002387.1/~~gb/GECG01002387.1/.p1  ORF type:complete len:307 (+),score=35.46 gb/GECG01002387.1/:1-921(+)
MRLINSVFMTALLLTVVGREALAASRTTGNFEMDLSGNVMTLTNTKAGITTKMECTKAGGENNLLDVTSTATVSITGIQGLAIHGSINLMAGITSPSKPAGGELELKTQLATESGTIDNPSGSVDWSVKQGTLKWTIHAENWDLDAGEKFEVHFEMDTNADIDVDSRTEGGVEVKVLSINGEAAIQMPIEVEVDSSTSTEMDIEVDGSIIKCIFPNFSSTLNYDPTTANDNGATALKVSYVLASTLSSLLVAAYASRFPTSPHRAAEPSLSGVRLYKQSPSGLNKVTLRIPRVLLSWRSSNSSAES